MNIWRKGLFPDTCCPPLMGMKASRPSYLNFFQVQPRQFYLMVMIPKGLDNNVSD